MKDFTLIDVAKTIQEQHPELPIKVIKNILSKAFHKIIKEMNKKNTTSYFNLRKCDIMYIFTYLNEKKYEDKFADLDETKFPTHFQEQTLKIHRKRDRPKLRVPVWYSGQTQDIPTEGPSTVGVHSRECQSASDVHVCKSGYYTGEDS